MAPNLFLVRFRSKHKRGQVDPWSEDELEDFIRELEPHGCLPRYLFIDALDEGDLDDTEQLLPFLKRLTKMRNSAAAIKICISTGHWSITNISDPLCLIVDIDKEDGRRNDMAKYTDQRLHDDCLHAKVLTQSSCNFRWLASMIDELNRCHAHGTLLPDCIAHLSASSSPIRDTRDFRRRHDLLA